MEASPQALSVLTDEGVATFSPEQLRAMRDEFQRFLLEYQFGLREVETKLGILRDEFQLMHDYNPIEHVSSRVKTADSPGPTRKWRRSCGSPTWSRRSAISRR